jgi:hypothetical protein
MKDNWKDSSASAMKRIKTVCHAGFPVYLVKVIFAAECNAQRQFID